MHTNKCLEKSDDEKGKKKKNKEKKEKTHSVKATSSFKLSDIWGLKKIETDNWKNIRAPFLEVII